MLFTHYLTAALLLLHLDSTVCTDYIETIADALGRHSVRRILNYLTEEECSDFFKYLTGPSKKSNEILTMEECRITIMKWYEDNADTTDLDHLYYALINIKRLDLAKALMDDLYKKVLEDFNTPEGEAKGGSFKENNRFEDEDELIILWKEAPADQSISLSLIVSIWFLSLLGIPFIALIVAVLCTCCALRIIDALDRPTS